MPTNYSPRGMIDSMRAARKRVPKRYPLLGFGIIGVYVVVTIGLAAFKNEPGVTHELRSLRQSPEPAFERPDAGTSIEHLLE